MLSGTHELPTVELRGPDADSVASHHLMPRALSANKALNSRLALLPEVQLNEAVGVGSSFPRESGETGGWPRGRWRESRHAASGSAPIEARRDKRHWRRSVRRSRRTLVCLLRRSLQPPFAGLQAVVVGAPSW